MAKASSKTVTVIFSGVMGLASTNLNIREGYQESFTEAVKTHS